MTPLANDDPRISRYIAATEQLRIGNYKLDLPAEAFDSIGELGQALKSLAQTLEQRYNEFITVSRITTLVTTGLLLDEVLNHVFDDFRSIIPYDRIGFAVLEENRTIVRSRWARTTLPNARIKIGFMAPLAGSSLETILTTRTPRIINDLELYLEGHPASISTRMIIEEGIRASLTCPLIVNNIPIGFIFFSSAQPHAYAHVHSEIFQQIAEQLAVILEKSLLISQLTQQKNELERQNNKLKELNGWKNTFLGMAAHDLRTPLSVIHMAADILRRPDYAWTEQDRQQMLVNIQQQARHMLTQLSDLLDMTQIESGTFTIDPQPFEIAPILTEAAKRHQMLATPKGTQIVITELPTGPIYTDERRLHQILDNLLSNAIKYAPAGSTVQLSATREGDWWRIKVADEGPGLRPEDHAQLFKHFAKLSARPTGGEKSTGLGLAITYQVVQALGGTIGVNSVLGQGATFWFTMRVTPPLAEGVL